MLSTLRHSLWRWWYGRNQYPLASSRASKGAPLPADADLLAMDQFLAALGIRSSTLSLPAGVDKVYYRLAPHDSEPSN
jgi:hypothetical protein